MSDYDHRYPGGDQVFYNYKQLIHFLRSKNRSRLIKNQNIRLTVKSFQNLNPLLQAYRKRLDQSIRIYIETVSVG